jgi:hypothetical protein
MHQKRNRCLRGLQFLDAPAPAGSSSTPLPGRPPGYAANTAKISMERGQNRRMAVFTKEYRVTKSMLLQSKYERSRNSVPVRAAASAMDYRISCLDKRLYVVSNGDLMLPE